LGIGHGELGIGHGVLGGWSDGKMGRQREINSQLITIPYSLCPMPYLL